MLDGKFIGQWNVVGWSHRKGRKTFENYKNISYLKNAERWRYE